MRSILSSVLLMLAMSVNVVACVKGDSDIHSSDQQHPTTPSTPEEGSGANEKSRDTLTRLNITVGPKILTAVLYDNVSARDFVSRLPLTVDMSDFANAEKIFTPSPGIDVDGAPLGFQPKAGDIAVYAPWRNIAVYYGDEFSFAASIIPIGHIDGDISAIRTNGMLRNVRFERVVNNK